MDVDQAATFLAGAILTGAGFCVGGIVIVFLNNLFHKYWKPVKIFTPETWSNAHARFATEEELQRIEPKVDEPKEKK
jgi:hypothetical protein